MNALVLYVGTQAITYIHSKSGTPSMSTITHSSHMDIFQNLAVDLDTEGTNLQTNLIILFKGKILTLYADRLAQLVERRTTVRKVSASRSQTGPTLRVVK